MAPASERQHTQNRFRGFLSPAFVLLGGLLLGLSLPNELITGSLGDHPPALLGWLALLPLWWGIVTFLPGKARWTVWLFGLVFYGVTLSWMRLFGYLPWALLALYLSLTPLLALCIAQRAARISGALLPVTFALAWTGLEWLRGQGLFGFAWSEVGASQVEGITSSMAALGGIPLITFLMLWVTGALIHRLRERRGALIPFVILAVCISLGAVHVSLNSAREQPASRLRVSVVQPNTTMGLTPRALVTDLSPAEYTRRERALLELSEQAILDAQQGPDGHLPRLVIWPESALSIAPPYIASIYQLRSQTKSSFLIGAPEWVGARLRNSAYLLTPDRRDESRYAKIHLVPFGEFVPFRSFVARFYTVRATDILPGERRETLRLDDHALGVGICFESTFAEIARYYARHGATLLIYITNDAWFHRTSAVRQHFNHARFRALETGLPVARAAGTGISGFIAPNGRVLKEIPTYTAGAATVTMPAGVPGTIYSRAGWLFGPLCLLVSLGLLLGSLPKRNSLSSRNDTSS
ncbi:MAG: apolipoprotein N-acyltransferase [Armatimonadota bacterium]